MSVLNGPTKLPPLAPQFALSPEINFPVGAEHNTLGAYFTDLPSNMLGSFVMGLLAAAATLGLDSKKLLAVLPANSSWQHLPELHIGLRTGYCGSLTTFASWELDLIQPLIGGKVCCCIAFGYSL